MQARFRLTQPGWWIAGSLALMAVGAVGPWARVLDMVTVYGIDDGKDGWVVLVGACLAGLLLLVYAKARRRWLLIVPFVAALAGAVTAGYDIHDLGSFGSIAEAQWGIYLALVGSIAVAATTFWLAVAGRHREKLAEITAS